VEQPFSVADDLSQLVSAAVSLINDGTLDAHVRWSLLELINRVAPDDLTPGERMSMCAILARAHARKLTLTGYGATRGLAPFLGPLPRSARPNLRLIYPSADLSQEKVH
jgi:hypothetical protein